MFPGQSGLFGEEPPRRTGSADWVTAFCDGGSRGNPGPAGFGVYIEGSSGEKLAELSEYIGKATNNVAEYSALLAALDWALKNGHPKLRVVGDSELLVKQMQGRYKVASPDLRPLYEEAKRRVAQLEMFRIEHVLRGKNQRADRLANLAMDKGTGRGPAASSAAKPAPSAPAAKPIPIAPRPDLRSDARSDSQRPAIAKGYVKGGVVHLIEGELPEGAFVKVTFDRQNSES
ncbi:MAG: ribonuclease HI family protein [Acidobacteriota bacterium]